jgi:peroxiredoxin
LIGKEFTKMKRKFSTRWLILILALVVAPAYASPVLRSFDGSLHTLDEYKAKGKWTVVMIWASYCPTCNAEVGNYVKFNDAHKNKDAQVVGISIDGKADKAEAVKFIKRHHVDFKNLIGEEGDVIGMYSTLSGKHWLGTPSFLIFSPSGKLRAAQAGAVSTNVIESYIAKHSKS